MTSRLPACRETLENISAYLDQELDATACERVESHALGCEPCAALVSGLRTTLGLCRRAGEMDLPDEVRRRARASIQRLLGGGTPAGD
jgi:anti-sigma factor RsiW